MGKIAAGLDSGTDSECLQNGEWGLKIQTLAQINTHESSLSILAKNHQKLWGKDFQNLQQHNHNLWMTSS